jgi:DNA-binding GntR family transcriptional regulator
MSVREIADQYEIRTALEAFTMKTVAGRLTPAQVKKLRANLDAQARLLVSADLAKGVELDAAFHSLFPEFLGNQEITRVVGQLRDKMQRVVMQVFRVCPTRIETSYQEHEAIARAVIDGKGDTAAELIVAHLVRSQRLILAPRS